VTAAAKQKPAPRVGGRKPFVEAALPARFTRAQLAAVDAAVGDDQRQRWMRAQLEAACAAGRDIRARGLARELLDSVRGVEAGVMETVTVRFGAELWAQVNAEAKACGMIASVWIREVVLAVALPDLYRDATKLAALASRLSDD
jgi:hypothetical protein